MLLGFKSLVVVVLVALLGPALALPEEVATQNVDRFLEGKLVDDKTLTEKWYNTLGSLALTMDPLSRTWLYGNRQLVVFNGQNCLWSYNQCYAYNGVVPGGGVIPTFSPGYAGYFGGGSFNTINGYSLYNAPGRWGYFNNPNTGYMGVYPYGLNFGRSRLFNRF